MDVLMVTRFFALLLIGGTLGVLAAIAAPELRASLGTQALALSSIVAGAATTGSLYLSESVGLVPCELCWFQRLAMYPIAIVGIAALARRDLSALRHMRVLSIVGLGIALYHVQLQAFPDQSSFCELANPCSSTSVKALGFMTIPQMSALAFLLIALVSTFGLRPSIATVPKQNEAL